MARESNDGGGRCSAPRVHPAQGAGRFARNHWYAAGTSKELGRDLLPRTILGEPMVFYRLEDGTCSALEDRCPHRNVPLSLGKAVGNRVQCPYHGLEFLPTGACAAMPRRNGTPPKGYAVRAYPTLERDGFIWVWPGDSRRCDPALVPDYHWHSDPGWAGDITMRTVEVNYILNLENLLDLSHIAYVHTESIGAPQFATTEVQTRVTQSSVEVYREHHGIEANPLVRAVTGWERTDHTSKITYTPASNFVLSGTFSEAGSNDPSKQLRVQFAGPSTPETARSHHHFSTAYRNFATDNPQITSLFIEMVKRSFAEDLVLLEAQQRRIDEGVYPDPKLFYVDKGAAAGLRLLNRAIAEEYAGPTAVELGAMPS